MRPEIPQTEETTRLAREAQRRDRDAVYLATGLRINEDGTIQRDAPGRVEDVPAPRHTSGGVGAAQRCAHS